MQLGHSDGIPEHEPPNALEKHEPNKDPFLKGPIHLVVQPPFPRHLWEQLLGFDPENTPSLHIYAQIVFKFCIK